MFVLSVFINNIIFEICHIIHGGNYKCLMRVSLGSTEGYYSVTRRSQVQVIETAPFQSNGKVVYENYPPLTVAK